MNDILNEWTLLVYKVPNQPSRLRLQVWRKLQGMGALYLQDAVCLLPARDDLSENLHYIAQMVEEMGGACQLFSASALLPDGAQQIVADFQRLADSRLEEVLTRLDKIAASLESAASPSGLEAAEEAMKRERIAYLRARRLNYFGSVREAEADARLEQLRQTLDDLHRSRK